VNGLVFFLIENIVEWNHEIQDVTKRVAAKEADFKRKRISESKGESVMAAYTGEKSDKHTFKEWSDKLINQFAVIYPHSRYIFNRIKESLNMDRKVLSNESIQTFCGSEAIMKDINEDLYYILIDKTTKTSKLKIDGVEPGNGFEAFQALYLWFSGTSGEMLSWKTAKVMNPNSSQEGGRHSIRVGSMDQ